jgi:hypothetical protein
MLPTLGKILWLKAGKRADGYNQPTINEDKTSYRYPLRASFWNSANDVRLGEITDTNQPDLDGAFSTTTFIEFKDAATGELKYILYNAVNFESRYEVREPEADTNDNLLTIYKKNRTWVIVAVVAIVAAIGLAIRKAAMRGGSSKAAMHGGSSKAAMRGGSSKAAMRGGSSNKARK